MFTPTPVPTVIPATLGPVNIGMVALAILALMLAGTGILMLFLGYRLLIKGIGLTDDDANANIQVDKVKIQLRARRVGTACMIFSLFWGLLAYLCFHKVVITPDRIQTRLDRKLEIATNDFNRKLQEKSDQLDVTQTDVVNLKKITTSQGEAIARIPDYAKEPLKRAEEAGKLAKGKLIFEVSLSDDVKFDFRAAGLSDEAKSKLISLATRLKGEKRTRFIEIEGYCDRSEIEGDTNNPDREKQMLLLGEQRAEAVARFLHLECGLPLHCLHTISLGDTKPIADPKTPEGAAKNRRVTLVVLE